MVVNVQFPKLHWISGKVMLSKAPLEQVSRTKVLGLNLSFSAVEL